MSPRRKPVRLTLHAIERYRERIDAGARTGDVDQALQVAASDLRHNAPSGASFALTTRDERIELYAVAGDVVFPLVDRGDHYLATTCVRRARRSKAERRAWRESRRDVEGGW